MTTKDTSLYCCYCGNMFSIYLRMTADHLIPLCRGGRNSPYNKRNCCYGCNQSKGGSYPEVFLSKTIKKYNKFKKQCLGNTSSHNTLSAKVNYEILIENIKYIVEYVASAGEKLFIDKYHYELYLEEISSIKQQLNVN